MKYRKLLAGIMAAVMTAAAISGCSQRPQESGKTEKSETETKKEDNASDDGEAAVGQVLIRGIPGVHPEQKRNCMLRFLQTLRHWISSQSIPILSEESVFMCMNHCLP